MNKIPSELFIWQRNDFSKTESIIDERFRILDCIADPDLIEEPCRGAEILAVAESGDLAGHAAACREALE